MVFAELDVQKSFRGKDVHREAAVPEGYAEAKLRLAGEVDLVLVDGDFKDAFERDFGHELGIEKAEAIFFHGEALDVTAFE